MANAKSELWAELKAAGWVPAEGRGFVHYKLAELEAVKESLLVKQQARADAVDPTMEKQPEQLAPRVPRRPAPPQQQQRHPWDDVPRSETRLDPNEQAGQRLNTQDPNLPIRIQPSNGRAWFQEEVRKPGTATPRGRRVLTINDPGTKLVTIPDPSGEAGATESFETAGDRQGQQTTIKVTLPSHQVGIYKDPRMPFKVITYAGVEAFDREDVERFYGGRSMVPKTVKPQYVSSTLCYDIRSVIEAIQAEDRRNQLSRGGHLQ